MFRKKELPPSTDAKLKHLEFIQAAISRMATNSFLFKGWAITVAAGLSAYAAVASRRALLILVIGTTVLFWGLDGYYLWLERCFRVLHRQVAALRPGSVDFNMEPPKPNRVRRLIDWLRACFAPHLVVFYGIIVVVDLIGIKFITGK